MMLSMMIFGQKQQGNDIDFYLIPSIEDLRVFREEGIDVDDTYMGDNFKMHARLFFTINDFPAYSNFSGYNVNGHIVCPICENDTCIHKLQNGKNTIYLGYCHTLKFTLSLQHLLEP